MQILFLAFFFELNTHSSVLSTKCAILYHLYKTCIIYINESIIYIKLDSVSFLVGQAKILRRPGGPFCWLFYSRLPSPVLLIDHEVTRMKWKQLHWRHEHSHLYHLSGPYFTFQEMICISFHRDICNDTTDSVISVVMIKWPHLYINIYLFVFF